MGEQNIPNVRRFALWHSRGSAFAYAAVRCEYLGGCFIYFEAYTLVCLGFLSSLHFIAGLFSMTCFSSHLYVYEITSVSHFS